MYRSSHILIVDDHRELRELVGGLLRNEGFRVTAVADGNEMRRALRRHHIDLIILDLMLRAEDGLDLCRELRAERSSVSIIMLTAKGDEIDRVLGLELGADDYLAKPFGGRELIARVKAVLRRTREYPALAPEPGPAIYRFGKWSLDVARREIEADDDLVVALSTGEYNLLLAFVRHPQRVLNRDQLLDLTKGRSAVVSDRGIDLQVSRLRKKIEDDPRHPKLINTAWGDGYIFTPRVTSE